MGTRVPVVDVAHVDGGVAEEWTVGIAASVLAALVAVLTSRRLGTRWRADGTARPVYLAWSVGMAMVAIAATMLAVGAGIGFNGPLYRLQYLFGIVLDVPWLALGVVLAASGDRVTSRLTGAATLVIAAVFVPGALGADSIALVGVVFAGVWALVLLDGEPTRVRVGSSLLVALFSLLAITLVLPAQFSGPLPETGLPVAAEVLSPAVRGLGAAGLVVGSVVGIIGSLVAAGRLVLRHGAASVPLDDGRVDEARVDEDEGADTGADRGAVRARPDIAWATLSPVVRDQVLGQVLLASGISLVAGSSGLWSSLGGVTGQALGLGIGVVLVAVGVERVPGGGTLHGPHASTGEGGPATRMHPRAPRGTTSPTMVDDPDRPAGR